MIKVIIKRRVRKRENIILLLQELRMEAMLQRGYVTGETLLGAEDKDVVVLISTWRSLEDWKRWEGSEKRAIANRHMEPLLVEGPSVEAYEIMSADEIDYQENPFGWLSERERPWMDG
jgi:heme-degrading monooxygenase HmoA